MASATWREVAITNARSGSMSHTFRTLEIRVFRDRLDPDAWRVEGFDEDGQCEVAIFSGPDAEGRARRFAASEYGLVAEE